MKETCRTCSPNACGWGRVSTEKCFVPLSKEPVDDLPFIICDRSLHLIHTWIPVFGLWNASTVGQERSVKWHLLVAQRGVRYYKWVWMENAEIRIMSSCSQQMLLLCKPSWAPVCECVRVCCWAGVFNERWGCIMTSDMSWLDILRSFRRSFKWPHAKAINLLLSVKASIDQKLKTWRGSCWHAGEEHHLCRRMPFPLLGGYFDQTPWGVHRGLSTNTWPMRERKEREHYSVNTQNILKYCGLCITVFHSIGYIWLEVVWKAECVSIKVLWYLHAEVL